MKSAPAIAVASLVSIGPEHLLKVLDPLAGTFDHQLSTEELLRIGRAAIDDLVPPVPVRVSDPRVQRIIQYASCNLDQPLTLARASEGIYLSPSRLRHLFVEQTGVAFKTYLLWLRLVRAADLF